MTEAESAEGLAQRAEVLQDLGRHQEAITAYGQLVALVPDDVTAWCGLARAYWSAADYQRALDTATVAITHGPDEEWPFRLRSLALSGLRRHDEALMAATQAVQRSPDAALAHLRLANTQLDTGRLAEAQASAERTIALDPELTAAHHTLGIVLKHQRRFEDSAAALRNALAIDPQDAAAHTDLARLERGDKTTLAVGDRLTRAVDGYIAALRSDPTATATREELDEVVWRILHRLSYPVAFAVAAAAWLNGHSAAWARWLPVALLVVPVLLGLRFRSVASSSARRHFHALTVLPRVRVVLLATLLAGVTLIGSAAVPFADRWYLLAVALPSALVAEAACRAKSG